MKRNYANVISEFIDKQFPSNKHESVKVHLVFNLNKVKKELKIEDEDLIKILNTEEGLYELKLEKRTTESHYLISYILMSFGIEFEKVLANYEHVEQLVILENLIGVLELKLDRQSSRIVYNKHLELVQSFGERYKVINLSQINAFFNSDLLMYKCVGDKKWDYYTQLEFDLLENGTFLSEYELEFVLVKILDSLDFKYKLLLQKNESYLSNLGNSTNSKKGKKSIKNHFVKFIKLEDAFKSMDEYLEILQYLVERKIIYENSNYWTDVKKSGGSVLISLLKLLERQNYFSRGLEAQERLEIAKNTFNVVVSKSVAKRGDVSVLWFKGIPRSKM